MQRGAEKCGSQREGNRKIWLEVARKVNSPSEIRCPGDLKIIWKILGIVVGTRRSRAGEPGTVLYCTVREDYNRAMRRLG